jgi:ABC-type branched-subunit amino acid transport system ATPase component
MHRRARLGMGYLTQEPSVFRKLTVEQNILAILETCRMQPGRNGRFGSSICSMSWTWRGWPRARPTP